MTAGGFELSALLGEHKAAVESALATLAAAGAMRRLFAKDHTLWSPDPTEIADRLGWLDSPAAMVEALPAIRASAEGVRAACYRDALLLGMGGSSLAPELFAKAFGATGPVRLSILDSTDPGAVAVQARRLNPQTSLYIVSSKSGGTIETSSLSRFFYNQTVDAVGRGRAGEHFIAITDPGSGLAASAEALGFRATFLNDPNIGGRYSALSCFGMVPALLAGVDGERLLGRAREVLASSREEGCPAERLGAILGELAKAGRDKLTLVTSPALAPFGDWLEQLIAESTGKDGRGILPVAGELLEAPEVYGDDRLFVSLTLGDGPPPAGLVALEEAGHPVVRLRLRDLYDLGGQFVAWEIATAIAGAQLGINPFDQPNVESAKVLAREMVAAYGREGRLPQADPVLREGGLTLHGPGPARPLGEYLAAFLRGSAGAGVPRPYVALQAYLLPAEGTDRSLQSLRRAILRRFRLATTAGYGPRFLHSTGQLHKGDAGNGLFVQFTARMPEDLPIPDEAGAGRSSITFGVLKTAQALGDYEALARAGRRVIRIDLGEDVAGGLEALAALIASG